jgi:adenylate cyclase class IV
MSALEGFELEYKYRADNVSLEDFQAFCLKQGQALPITAAGYDYFYADPKRDGDFLRHRIGPEFNQLTLKRKLSEDNVLRNEYNLTLGQHTPVSEVEAHAKALGFEFNRRIYKNVFVYQYEKYILCFYACYDDNLKELGRFIEIEMAEDYPWKSQEEARQLMQILEDKIGVLGITYKNRMRKSLFEQFRK